jgi:hypothetical protein
MDDKQKQLVDSATCDVVSEAIHGNVDAVCKWLHGDGRHNNNMSKHKVILYRAAAEDHNNICRLVIDCDSVTTDDLIYALRNACCYNYDA